MYSKNKYWKDDYNRIRSLIASRNRIEFKCPIKRTILDSATKPSSDARRKLIVEQLRTQSFSPLQKIITPKPVIELPESSKLFKSQMEAIKKSFEADRVAKLFRGMGTLDMDIEMIKHEVDIEELRIKREKAVTERRGMSKVEEKFIKVNNSKPKKRAKGNPIRTIHCKPWNFSSVNSPASE